jgi:hypothetical protein
MYPRIPQSLSRSPFFRPTRNSCAPAFRFNSRATLTRSARSAAIEPGLGVLRQMGEGARRNLLCGFCLCEWEFRRIVCPGCDEKDHAKLPVYTADEFSYIRVNAALPATRTSNPSTSAGTVSPILSSTNSLLSRSTSGH